MSEAAHVLDGSTLLAEWSLPEPPEDGSKHERGSIAVVGGAAATPGAVLLAGLAALRVGAGRLSIATVDANAPALAVALPEAGVSGLPTTRSGTLGAAAIDRAATVVEDADAVLLGPGMDGPDEARSLVEGLLGRAATDATIVLDALALTCGAIESDRLASRRSNVVITPNSTEAERLLEQSSDSLSETDVAQALAARFGVVSLVGSAVAAPDGRCWATPKGNRGLATSGSGDVLAGAVAGLAARGASPLQAALWGVTLHSAAGDRLARRVGPIGYLARELLDELPAILSHQQLGE
jgi:hydroxyethylthiazole kinase-like uncharacterized protein yjeF